MECAEHPIATPRTNGEDLAEHISTNQEGYRVNSGDDSLLKCWRCLVWFAPSTHITHPGMSFDIGTDSIRFMYDQCVQLERCHMAHCNHAPIMESKSTCKHWGVSRHAMSHARKTGKAFKRLLPKEAPMHLGRPAHVTENINLETSSFEPSSMFSSSMSQKYDNIQQHPGTNKPKTSHLLIHLRSPHIYPVTQWSEWMQRPALGRTLGQSPGEITAEGNGFRCKTRFDIEGIRNSKGLISSYHVCFIMVDHGLSNLGLMLSLFFPWCIIDSFYGTWSSAKHSPPAISTSEASFKTA